MQTSDPITGAVLIGIDDTPAARAALAWGLARAARDRRAVRLVRIEAEGASRIEGRGRRTHPLLRATEQARRAHPGLVVDALLVSGDPADAFLRLAECGDLVVLGASSKPDADALPQRLLRGLRGLRAALAVVPAEPLRSRSGVVVGSHTQAVTNGLTAWAGAEAAGERVLVVRAPQAVSEPAVPAAFRGSDIRSVLVRGRQAANLLALARDARLMLLAHDDDSTELLIELLQGLDAPLLIITGCMLPAVDPAPEVLRLAG